MSVTVASTLYVSLLLKSFNISYGIVADHLEFESVKLASTFSLFTVIETDLTFEPSFPAGKSEQFPFITIGVTPFVYCCPL